MYRTLTYGFRPTPARVTLQEAREDAKLFASDSEPTIVYLVSGADVTRDEGLSLAAEIVEVHGDDSAETVEIRRLLGA